MEPLSIIDTSLHPGRGGGRFHISADGSWREGLLGKVSCEYVRVVLVFLYKLQSRSNYVNQSLLKIGSRKLACPEPELVTFKEPMNRFLGIDSASVRSLAGRYSITLFVLLAPARLHRLAESIPGLLKRLQIQALSTAL